MTSEGNRSVSDYKEVVFEVRQDHRWEIDASVMGVGINGSTHMLSPGGSIEFGINATNTGNLVDDLMLQVQTKTILVGSDQSLEWVANGSSAENVSVNGTVSLSISASSPEDAWNGSIMEVNVTALARGTPVYTFGFFVEVTHTPGWGVSSTMADLEINPEGSEVELEIIQRGNAPTIPFVSVYVTGQTGWEIGELPDLEMVQPGQSVPLFLNVTPSDSATHGRTVELHLRVREGDSSGLVEITLPLRVSIVQDFLMEGVGPWVISMDGGHPQVKVVNTGNSPATISLEVIGLPQGWDVRGDLEVVLGVGEQRGVPIELVPSSDWVGDEKTIRIQAEDSAGNQHEIILNTLKSAFSWGSPPYIFAQSGDDAIIKIHGSDSDSEVVDSVSGKHLEWSRMGWLLPSSVSTGGEVSIDGEAVLTYDLFASESPTRQVVCSIVGELEDMRPTCSIANGSSEFTFQVLLIGDKGGVLDSEFGTVQANSSISFVNLSASDWEPLPGVRTISIRALDEKGRVIGSSERSFEIRRTDWNVGIGSVELVGEGEGQQINVPTKRLNENLLEGADCIVTLSAGNHYSEHLVDMTQAFVPAPKFDRPDVEDGTELVVTIGCSFPWDIDADPSDDEARLVLSDGTTIEDSIDELGTGILAAILVVGVYVGLTWILSNHRERGRMASITQEAIEKKMAQRQVKDSTEEEEQEAPPSEEDGGGEVELMEGSSEEVEGDVDEFDKRLRRLLER